MDGLESARAGEEAAAEAASDLDETLTRGRNAIVQRPRRTRSLVMWSGGLDSTFALARLLRHSRDEVFAHHIHLNVLREDNGKTRSRRCEYEAQAVARLLEPLKAAGAFEYSESRVDLTAFSRFAGDTTTAMYFAAQFAMSRGFTPFDRIVIGASSEDPRFRAGTELYAFRRTLLNRILRAVWESEEVPYLYVHEPRPSKTEECEFLGSELAALTVSCRHPETGGLGLSEDGLRPCGGCAKCRARNAAQTRLRDVVAA